MSDIHNVKKLPLLFINVIFNICLFLVATLTIPSIFGINVLAQDTTFDQRVSNYDSLVTFMFFIIFIIIIIYIIWKITHRTKQRRYFSADIKRLVLRTK